MRIFVVMHGLVVDVHSTVLWHLQVSLCHAFTASKAAQDMARSERSKTMRRDLGTTSEAGTGIRASLDNEITLQPRRHLRSIKLMQVLAKTALMRPNELHVMLLPALVALPTLFCHRTRQQSIFIKAVKTESFSTDLASSDACLMGV